MNDSYNDFFLKEYKYIFKKYKPIKKIGEGCFGNVYSVIRLKDKSAFAMKTEKINAKEKMLESEAYILYNLQKGLGIPKLITYGRIKNYNILIETLLGESLENIFIKRQLKCNIIDVCAVGIQIIDRLEWIHSNNIIYRDIKPENFLVGINDPNVIYVIDFGLCKKYRSSKTGKHILPKKDSKFCGNFKFSSSNTTRGKESSRRDDIISLGYMLIYLIKKGLPWDYIYKENKLTNSKYIELVFLKDTNAYGKLFDGLPSEFKEFIQYAENLKFDQDPNYSYLRSILNKIILNNNFSYERYHFSWINLIKKDENLSVSKKHYRKKRSLHQRLLQSLEKNKNNNILNERKILLNRINISNQPDTTLKSFKTLNLGESNLSNINNEKGEEKILKTKIFEYNKIFPKNKLLYSKEQYYKPINKKFYESINIQEINKQKINPDSLFKETFSNINTKRNERRIYNDNFTNSYSKNSISNSKVSVKSFFPKNNVLISRNNLDNKKLNNNKMQSNKVLKTTVNFKPNLNIKTNNNNKIYLTIKDKLKNHNSHDYSNNNI